MSYKKPRIKQIVYIICNDYIYCSKVYMKGIDSFCTIETFNDLLIEESRREHYYKDYNKTWFTSFKEIKKSIFNTYNNVTIKKTYKDFWEIFVKEK